MGMSETNSKLMLLYSLNFLAFFTARSCLHFFFLNMVLCFRMHFPSFASFAQVFI